MLDLVVDLIDERVPVPKLTTTLLDKVGRLGNVLQQHWVDIERVIRPIERKETPDAVVLFQFKQRRW